MSMTDPVAPRCRYPRVQDAAEPIADETTEPIDAPSCSTPSPHQHLLSTDVPVRTPLPRIETLVLSGGSTKGLAHIGSIRILLELNMLSKLKRYVGTSVGGLIVALLCAGYTINELFREVMQLDFASLQQPNPRDMFTNLGMDTGERFVRLLKRLISAKHDPNITLAQLHAKCKKSLHLTTACLNTGKLVVLNYATEPHLPLWKALRMTTSLPIMFAPVEHNGYLYVDGGCIDNFPMSLFPSKHHTFGIMLHEPRNPTPVTNLEDFVRQMLIIMINNTCTSYVHNSAHTVTINLPVTSAVNFSMSNAIKMQMHDLGVSDTINKFTDSV